MPERPEIAAIIENWQAKVF